MEGLRVPSLQSNVSLSAGVFRYKMESGVSSSSYHRGAGIDFILSRQGCEDQRNIVCSKWHFLCYIKAYYFLLYNSTYCDCCTVPPGMSNHSMALAWLYKKILSHHLLTHWFLWSIFTKYIILSKLWLSHPKSYKSKQGNFLWC